MNISDSLVYRVATEMDSDSLATLINNAYRSPIADQGWTNENTLVLVPRANAKSLSNMIQIGKSIMLMFFGEDDQILKGCICLSPQLESKTATIGLFAVRPDFQARGYGKFIISTAEKYAINSWNVEYIKLSAIVQRPELINYYTRRGYIDTGKREPFFGPHLTPKCVTRDDLEICTMIKCVKNEKGNIS
ncbi:unnamed protein product [Adineta steineri]|uniref:N-acetyltransferase domain-containing protein n=1 Tax=Adineta steineri TaxID=433720 RepID=A0A815NM87_9BILA|nr:unnamed protein product [Adineta steineri]CAF1441663.1 unnamed protein product [Adineta steineri]CAF4029910.1 unnamed protein product [Adineta steineri]CAF4268506.1 unnamed protein product [Adineta steineri]